MKKSVLRTSFIVILLFGNCFFIAGYFMRPPHPKHEGPRDEIIQLLHFDEQQIEKYDLLIQKHQGAIRSAEKDLLQSKNALYKNLDKPIDSTFLANTLKQQTKIEQIHYAHFQDIKLLCKPNQQVYFKKLNNHIAQLFTHRMKPKK